MTPDEIREQYEEALVDYRSAVSRRLMGWRPMKDTEAEIVVNGGYGEVVIDGRNAEQREAQLRLARNLHPAWVAWDISVRTADADKESAFATMEMCKAFLQHETALANERAAIGAGTLDGVPLQVDAAGNLKVKVVN